MKLSKGPLFMAVAGLIGLLASYAVHHHLSSATKVAAKPIKHLVVAVADISPGTMLTGVMLKTTPWPEESMPPTAIATLKEAEGRVIISPISLGEPILHNKLAPVGTAAGLGALLPNGKRALSVRVDDVSGVAGFVHPGDHVDLLVEMMMPESKEHFSKTLLQNIVILTTGQTYDQVRDQRPALVNTVTLALTNEEAELVNLASNQGRIRLALRNRNDPEQVYTKGVGTSGLFGTRKREAAPAAAKQVENNQNVEVIKGLARTQFSY